MKFLICRIADVRTAYVSVILFATLCTAAEEDKGNELGKMPAILRLEKEEWTKEVIEDTVALMATLEMIEDFPIEELDQIRACFAGNKSLKECGQSANRRKKRWSLASLWTSAVNRVKSSFFQKIDDYINAYKGNYTCYEGIGCFHPTDKTGLAIGGPEAPEKIGTRFEFFSNLSSDGVEVNHTTWEQYYRSSQVDMAKPFIGITHGFTRDDDMSWMKALKDALLSKIDCNVLIIYWIDGAMFPDYAAAAANTPLPGVLLSLLLQKMMRLSESALRPQEVHLIGFSLGAHQAGFCARHFELNTGMKLGRITGLDPAGPLYENSNVSLSKTDALFVDIIHTNGGKLSESRLGLNESRGHVDFYPNGGSDQPECTDPLSLVCSHKRAQALFIESVTSTNCSFTSRYCQDGWKEYGKCKLETNSTYLGEMGYDSIKKPGRGNQFLETNNKAPYCTGGADELQVQDEDLRIYIPLKIKYILLRHIVMRELIC